MRTLNVRRALIVFVLSAALLAAPRAAAKDFTTLFVVGADGRSTTLRPAAGVLDSFHDGGSPLNRGRRWVSVAPRGGFVRLYLTVRDATPGIPGRYYPASRAACFGWIQAGAAAPRPCYVPNATLVRLLAVARRHSLFAGAPPALRRLVAPALPDVVVRVLRVSVVLAFDRWRDARQRRKPRSCIAFRARWRDVRRPRPEAFCLGPAGVWAAGMLFPLGRGAWSFAWLNRRRPA